LALALACSLDSTCMGHTEIMIIPIHVIDVNRITAILIGTLLVILSLMPIHHINAQPEETRNNMEKLLEVYDICYDRFLGEPVTDFERESLLELHENCETLFASFNEHMAGMFVSLGDIYRSIRALDAIMAGE
jgi:hypothetical protein